MEKYTDQKSSLMSPFSYPYQEPANLIATIMQANTLTDLHALFTANIKMFNANREVRERYEMQHSRIMRQMQGHETIVR